MRSYSSIAVALLLGAGCGGPPQFSGETVRVLGPGGEVRLEVFADVADDERERREGLARYDSLAAGRGLLIVLPAEGEVCITNAKVDFAVDAVFAATDGTVVAVERNVPRDDVTLRCHRSTRRILEVNGGDASAVSPGDQLVF